MRPLVGLSCGTLLVGKKCSKEVSGRLLLLEMSGKICSSKVSVNGFGLWKKSMEGEGYSLEAPLCL